MTSNTPPLPQVFISYAGEDTAVAESVCVALEESAIPCWIAPRDIRPGAEYGEAIVEAIRNARILVLVFSAFANASVQVRREVERAVSNNLVVIPFRIEELPPSNALEYFLSATHWLDAFPGPPEDHLPFLVESVTANLSQPSAGGRGAAASRRRWKTRRPLPRWALPAAAAALLLAASPAITSRLREWLRPPAQSSYRMKATEAFNRGQYEEARRALDLWHTEDPSAAEARELLSRLVHVTGQIETFELALKQRNYERASAALLLLRDANPHDPNLPDRRRALDAAFSPEFQDDFLGGLDFWDSPEGWHAGQGKLVVQGPGTGWLRDWYYGDFEARFNLTLTNQAGALWIVRGRDNDGYYFHLTGPKGSPPNSFAAFRYRGGRREPLLGPIAAGGDLSVPDDQLTIIVKARGETLEHSVKILSAPGTEPRMLGSVRDGAFASGRFGFTTRAGEAFLVRAFKIIPLKEGEGS
jgi:hypothetical protein